MWQALVEGGVGDRPDSPQLATSPALAIGGKAAATEAQRMVSEKIEASLGAPGPALAGGPELLGNGGRIQWVSGRPGELTSAVARLNCAKIANASH